MRFESETDARRHMAEHKWQPVIETIYSARGVRINAVDGTGRPHTCRVDHQQAAAGAPVNDPSELTPAAPHADVNALVPRAGHDPRA